MEANSLIGIRVEISPLLDLWMRGARYGEIIGNGRGANSDFFKVKLDKLKKPVFIHGDLLTPIL